MDEVARSDLSGDALVPPPCPLCEGDEWVVLYEGLKDRQFDLPGVFRVWRCGACGVWRLWPVPDDLDAHYPDAYGPHTAVTRRFVSRPWHRMGWRLSFSPRSSLRRFGRWLLQFNQAALEMLTYVDRPPRSVFDYGCGSGVFLGFASQLPVAGFGIDVSQSAVDRAKASGIACDVGTYEDLPLNSGQRFDLVRLWHVLEHLSDPVGALVALRPRLSERGTLVIAVPNTQSAPSDLFKSDWYHLDAPRHLWGFNEAVLRSTIEKAGYDVERVVVDHSGHGVYESMRYGLETSGSKASLREPPDSAIVAGLDLLTAEWNRQGAGDFMIATAVVQR
jgi:SAM-dependent methyltransferase